MDVEIHRGVAAAALAAAACLSGWMDALAAEPEGEVPALMSLDIERLLDIEIELASRVQERAFDAATAIHVVDRRDIERSASRRLPDLLRQVPGMHVGRFDGNKWAVSSRNALGRFTSTLLVMVDGRHVYTPLYGGVRWEEFNLPLEDIERIEVVRGAGGPLWGANAVDGIINIVTRSTADTRGNLVLAGGGAGMFDAELLARHGGGSADGTLDYRITAQHARLSEGTYLPTASTTHRGTRVAGADSADGGSTSRLDARADWRPGDGVSATFSAGVFGGRFDEERVAGPLVLPNAIDQRSAYAQAQWRRALVGGGEWRFSVAARRQLVEDDIAVDRETLVDLDLQNSRPLGVVDLTWGLGFRHYRSNLRPPDPVNCRTCFGAHPVAGGNDTASAFAHGRWRVGERTSLIAGAKVESSDYVDFDWQPTLRIAHGDRERTAWAAVSRAARSPTRLDRDLALFNVPASLQPFLGCRAVEGDDCLLGNRDADSWAVYSAEAGYRAQASARLGFDLAVFHNDFRGTLAAGESIGRDDVSGIELGLRFAAAPGWQLDASYARHRGRDRLATGERVPIALLPRDALALRSHVALSERLDFDLQASRVSSLPRRNGPPLPGQSRVDLKLSWRPRDGLAASIALVNAFDQQRAEYTEALKVNTAQGRGVFLGIEWRPE